MERNFDDEILINAANWTTLYESKAGLKDSMNPFFNVMKRLSQFKNKTFHFTYKKRVVQVRIRYVII